MGFFQCMRKSGMEDTTKAVLPCLLSVLQNNTNVIILHIQNIILCK